MQLPRACDPPHTPSTDAGPSTDACIQPDSSKNRLLQLCAARRSIQHHSEAPASPKQRGAYHSTSASTVRRQHWLPVEQRINYKLTVLTFKTQQTSSPQYLNQHISLRTNARNTRSLSVPLLCVPFRRTSFARRSFSTAAHLTWNSLPPAVLNCDSLSLLSNQDLKLIRFLPLSANYSTYLFHQRLCSR